MHVGVKELPCFMEGAPPLVLIVPIAAERYKPSWSAALGAWRKQRCTPTSWASPCGACTPKWVGIRLRFSGAERVNNYSLENSHNPFIFKGHVAAIFMVRCGSKNHGLFVSERDDGIDTHCAASRNVACRESDKG
jgi:hypothetical protein